VKNIARPVRAYRVRLDGGSAGRKSSWVPSRRLQRSVLGMAAALFAVIFLGGVWWLWPAEPAPGKPAIAVLPFDDYGGDEAAGRLADGITEDIITDLARFRELDVIARNSTEVYKGKPVDVRQVGTELGVGYVLEGSIQRTGDRVRVNAQLVETRSGAHVWANRWDRPAGDLFAAQDELADQVASRLGGFSGSVAQSARSSAKRKRPEDLSAYELYLLGLERKHAMDRAAVEEAVGLFDQALVKDPTLARAHVGRAWAHLILLAYSPEDFAAHLAATEADARAAIALDPQDAEAHAALAEALYNQGRFSESVAEYERALQLNPSSADIASFATMLAFLGQPERAAELADRALRLNPSYPAYYPYYLGPAYFLANRPRDAIRIFESVPSDQRNLMITVPLAGAYAMLGQQQQAAEAIDEVRKADPSLSAEAAVATLWKLSRDQERRFFIDALGKAGLPVCADSLAVPSLPDKDRLPECEAERAKATAAKQ
jgi:TolB-like protein